jgi:putative transposase
MWTLENRARYNRDHLRYPSEAPDEAGTEVAALIPPARRGGCKRTGTIRAVFKGRLSILSTGCQWRAIPTDFPPRSTLFSYFGRWEAEGTWRRIQAAL